MDTNHSCTPFPTNSIWSAASSTLLTPFPRRWTYINKICCCSCLLCFTRISTSIMTMAILCRSINIFNGLISLILIFVLFILTTKIIIILHLCQCEHCFKIRRRKVVLNYGFSCFTYILHHLREAFYSAYDNLLLEVMIIMYTNA